MKTLKIDFVSDVACPWCAIGLNSLERALERVAPDLDAQLHFQPFELNPTMPPEGADTVQYLSSKYGITPEQIARNQANIRARGAAVGFAFGQRPRVWNTFDAHRLLHWAGLEGRALQLKEALFKSNFTDQRPSNDPATLIDAAREAGLDPERASQILQSGEFTDEVRALEAFWQSRGIHAVPSIIFNQHWMLQGAQPPEQFERAIRAIITGAAKRAPAPGAG